MTETEQKCIRDADSLPLPVQPFPEVRLRLIAMSHPLPDPVVKFPLVLLKSVEWVVSDQEPPTQHCLLMSTPALSSLKEPRCGAGQCALLNAIPSLSQPFRQGGQ